MSAFPADVSAFSLLTTLLGLAAAFVSGRALAAGWKPLALAILAAVPLALAVRLLDLMLVGQPLDPTYVALSWIGLAIAAVAGFSWRRRRQMRRQYPWLAAPQRP